MLTRHWHGWHAILTCYFCIYPEWLAVANRRLHNVIDSNAVSDRRVYESKNRLTLQVVPSKWVNRNYSVPMRLQRPKSSMVDIEGMVQLPIATIHTNTAGIDRETKRAMIKIVKPFFELTTQKL